MKIEDKFMDWAEANLQRLQRRRSIKDILFLPLIPIIMIILLLILLKAVIVNMIKTLILSRYEE